MRKILEMCPTCESPDLVVTEMLCQQCATTVRSRYRPNRFSSLSAENLRFVEIFVKNKGNVKEMERELNVSYWTIRSRLDEIIEQLGFDEPEPARVPLRDQRRAVLDQLEARAITVEQAAQRLSKLDTQS